MTAYNWAVVGVHVEDAKLTPVELFEEYEDARESMLCRIHTLVDESGLGPISMIAGRMLTFI